jgi:hypothetical protein
MCDWILKKIVPFNPMLNKWHSAKSVLFLFLPLLYVYFYIAILRLPIPVAARSKAWVCGHSLAGVVSSNPAGDMHVCLLWVLCVVRVLSVGLITRPEESYRVGCVWLWSWILDNEEALAHWGLLRHGKKIVVVETNCTLEQDIISESRKV